MGRFSTRSGLWLAAISLAVSASLGAVFALPAATFGATWVSEYPVSTIHAQPSIIGADVFGSAALDPRTAVVTIDGIAQKGIVTQGQALGRWQTSESLVGGVWVIKWTYVPGSGTTQQARVIAYPSMLADGPHTVAITVSDYARPANTFTDSWSFVVAQPPSFGAPLPQAGSVVNTLTPTISIPVSDNSPITSVSALVNSQPATATLSGKVVNVTGFTLAEGTATVSVTASDGSNSSTRSWTFKVATNDLCKSCHGTKYDADVAMGPNCVSCHTGGMEAHTGDPSSYHTNATLEAGCSDCHLAQLPDEHARHNITCLGCHGSSDAKVKGAISSGDSNCLTCHGVTPNHYEAVEHTATPAPAAISISGVNYGTHACSECHSLRLGDLHKAADGSPNCDTCHPTPRSTFTTWTFGCVQGGCHTPGSTAPMHANIDAAHAPLPGNSACTVCHAGTLADIHASAETTVAGQPETSCQVCHAGGTPQSGDCTTCHGASVHPTSAAFCQTCHTPAFGEYTGKSVYGTSKHATVTTSTVAAVVFPGSGASAGACANCHQGHNGLRAAGGGPNDLCYGCHDAAGTTKPAGYSYLGRDAFDSGAHGECSACHPVHGSSTGQYTPALVPTSDTVCLGCHNTPSNSANGVDVAQAFSGGVDDTSHHNLSVNGGDMQCKNCHQPHAATTTQLADPTNTSAVFSADKGNNGLENPDNPGTYFNLDGSVAADSVNQDEGEIDLPLVADTQLDSNNPSYNYGASEWLTVDSANNGLLRVDDSLLPPDSYITDAQLVLHADSPADRVDTIDTHLLQEPEGSWTPWIEGTGDGDVNNGLVNGATWLDRWYSNGAQPWAPKSWDVGGGSDETNWHDDGNRMYDEAPNGPYGPLSSSAFGDMAPDDTQVSFDVTKQMQTIFTTTDAPMDSILLKAGTPDGKLVFASKDNADESLRPYVRVSYYRTSMLLNPSKNAVASGGGVFYTGDRMQVESGDKGLLDFDLSAIPDGATVTSVKLMLYGQDPSSPSDGSLSVYSVQTDWQPGQPSSVILGDKVADYVADDYAKDWSAGVDQWFSFTGKDMLKALQKSDNHGLAIVVNDNSRIDVGSADGDDAHAPKLEIQYSMDSPTTDGSDSPDYCNTCHGDDMPSGMSFSSNQLNPGATLKSQWEFHNAHGVQMSKGPGSRPTFNWGASLKDPYFYGAAPLQCTDCHDPHGSENVYHLKSSINGQDGLVVEQTDGSDTADTEQWCAACHTLPQDHEWWGTNCLGCHYHGRTNTQRF